MLLSAVHAQCTGRGWRRTAAVGACRRYVPVDRLIRHVPHAAARGCCLHASTCSSYCTMKLAQGRFEEDHFFLLERHESLFE
jgi:hypothetical protein